MTGDVDPDLVRLVADAELGRGVFQLRGSRRSIGGAVLKSVLLVVAVYDGQPLTGEAIAARVCADPSTVRVALAWLMARGLVERIRLQGANCNAYRVGRAAVRACRRPSGTVANVTRRRLVARRRKLVEAAAAAA